MTIEEKAKAYDEALDRMKHVVIVPENEKALQALKETIFPELRESEDERIRKELISHFEAIKFVQKQDKFHGFKIDNVLAWLEKQKEQEHICDSVQYEEGFKTGLEIGLRKQKEQKPADDKAFEEWLDDWYKGSKEAGGDIVMSEAEFKNWSRGIRNMYQQKPVWSEEDETAFGDLMWCIEQARKSAKDENDMGNIWFAENWVKNRLKSFRPQLKQEWNDEDEDYMNAIITIINRETALYPKGGATEDLNNDLIAWLKSLRPQPSWKPNKEQIDAIVEALKYLPNNKDEWMILNTLADILMKLI